jgi:TonB family protein
MPAKLLLIARLTLLLALAAASCRAETLVLVEGPAPTFPTSLLDTSITTGAAYVACSIDDDGTVLEAWPIQATHPDFTPVSLAALSTWRYNPATPKTETTSWPRFEIVRFDFNRTSSLVSFSSFESHRHAASAETPSAHRLPELPLLAPGSLAAMHHPMPKLAPGTPAGEVQVEFLIDRTGQARVPVAIFATHPALARATVAAVRTWTFAPLPPEITTPAARYRWSFRFGFKTTGS